MATPLAQLRADEGVYEDAGGTDPCEDADQVVRWNYSAASSLTGNALQTVSGRQPVYNASDGGFPSIRFTDDVLVISHTGDWAGWSGLSWLCACYVTTITVNDYLWSFGSTAWTATGVRHTLAESAFSPQAITWHSGAYNTNRNALLHVRQNQWMVLAGTADATSMRLWLNRQAIARHTVTGSLALGTFSKTIGGAGDVTTYTPADVRLREIAWWNSALSESAMSAEVDAAMTRWSISNEIEPPESSAGSSGGGRPFPVAF